MLILIVGLYIISLIASFIYFSKLINVVSLSIKLWITVSILEPIPVLPCILPKEDNNLILIACSIAALPDITLTSLLFNGFSVAKLINKELLGLSFSNVSSIKKLITKAFDLDVIKFISYCSFVSDISSIAESPLGVKNKSFTNYSSLLSLLLLFI